MTVENRPREIVRRLVYEVPWAGEVPFGVEDDVDQLVEGLSLEELLDVFDLLGELKAHIGQARSHLTRLLGDAIPSPVRIGDQVVSVGKSYTWKVQDEEQFWAAAGDLVPTTPDYHTPNQAYRGGWEDGVAAALDLASRLFNANGVRVTALRSAAAGADVPKGLVDDSLIYKKWSETRSVSYRDISEVPGADEADPDGGIVVRKGKQ